MPRSMLSLALLLILPSVAHAVPFMPDQMDWTVLESRFVETGTNTACVNCEDADPLNDLTLTLEMFDGSGCCGFSTFFFGSVDFAGDLESIRDVNVNIEADIRVVTRLVNAPPEEIAQYPLPSVSYGTLTGFLLGANLAGCCGFDVVEDCCSGEVGGVTFKSPIGPSLWQIENIQDGLGFAGEASWSEAPYTPEVPEPATLLLVGSGLLGAGWKRRRRGRHPRATNL